MSRPRNHRHLFTVRYKRYGWAGERLRRYVLRDAANRYIRRLVGYEPGELAPLQYVRLERQSLGPIESVSEWGDS